MIWSPSPSALGYAWSAVLFAGLIALPAIGYRWFRLPAIPAFWMAYVLTRPLGASIADWLGKPVADGGRGWGPGWVALALTALIAVAVAYLALTDRGGDLDRAGPRTPTTP